MDWFQQSFRPLKYAWLLSNMCRVRDDSLVMGSLHCTAVKPQYMMAQEHRFLHNIKYKINAQHGCLSTAVLCQGLEKNGMASVNQIWPHCVNQMGKTHSKPLVARHGRGTAYYVWIGLNWAKDSHPLLQHIFLHNHQLISVPTEQNIYGQPKESQNFTATCSPYLVHHYSKEKGK